MPRPLFYSPARFLNARFRLSPCIVLGLFFAALPLSAPRAELDRNSCNQFTEIDVAIGICTSWIGGKDAGTADSLFYDYYIRGWAWARKKDYSRAISDYDEALRLRPNSLEQSDGKVFGSGFVYNMRAQAWSAKGDNIKGIADYNHAIRLTPNTTPSDYFGPFLGRGELFLKTGNTDRAIADFTSVLGTQTGKLPYYMPVRAFSLRGEAYEKKGERDQALADFRSAVALKLPDFHSDDDKKASDEARKKLAALTALMAVASPEATVATAVSIDSSPQRSSSWEPTVSLLTSKFAILDAGADKITTAQDCQSLCIRDNRCKAWEFES